MSGAGLLAMIAAQRETGEPFAMALNSGDFERLLGCLEEVYQTGAQGDELGDWAGSMVSAMAESLGIEFV